jgi:Na+-transporting NADH:ubiquinone oxidoreductase subunit A
MISARIRKGYNLNIAGQPSPEVKQLKRPKQVAALPEKIRFIKPRLLVEVEDKVKVGTPLFEDKRNSDLKFLSPF